MKYEYFIMRLNDEKFHGGEWTVRLGHGQLEKTVIASVSNPFPTAKTNKVDVPGRSGVIDITEATGVVFYNNKTVNITLQNEAYDEWFEEMIEELAKYDGRMVNFAFDDSTTVKWYYTGRVHLLDVNHFKNRCRLQIDTKPFMTKVDQRYVSLHNYESLDRSVNGWQIMEKPDSVTVQVRSPGIFQIFGNAGDVVSFRRQELPLQEYMIGMIVQNGCEYSFGNGSQTKCISDRNGWIELYITIDGSFYDWNGSSYMPCAFIRYLFTLRGNIDDEIVLPSNVMLRPRLDNYGDPGILIIDGECLLIEQNSNLGKQEIFPNIVMPGLRADRSGLTTDVAVSVVGQAAQDNPSIGMWFYEEKLG